ncbi:Uncharacterised protein [Mycoplasmopsis arginini]|nr:Uncharacterised protein [Chlamydia trachomatis]SGA02132.1 Uncharacterised protein [Chlamydia abortus]SGA06598.1 Uncharacterised protein [Mycoplasmopsis arginini]CRH48387.1 Uncharacterised protein [Chlamydia trachomatis]CRH55378.1 Uncharacterised protein [Chlamydia trachomatis]
MKNKLEKLNKNIENKKNKIKDKKAQYEAKMAILNPQKVNIFNI